MSKTSSSSSPGELPTTFVESDIDNLVDELNEIDFDLPMKFIAEHGKERIKQALEYARSKPAGQVRNLPAFIRFLVQSPGRIPQAKREAKQNKYTSGKYGHIVRR